MEGFEPGSFREQWAHTSISLLSLGGFSCLFSANKRRVPRPRACRSWRRSSRTRLGRLMHSRRIRLRGDVGFLLLKTPYGQVSSSSGLQHMLPSFNLSNVSSIYSRESYWEFNPSLSYIWCNGKFI